MRRVTKELWERAEIERSLLEASHTCDASLVTSENVIRRYLDPPSTTVYPLEFAYSRLGDLSGKTVLDLGCGSGENSLFLARRGAQVIGVDICESLIQLAERRLTARGPKASARFVVGSVHDLPLSNASIDIAFGMGILHHLDLDAASREVARVLKQGGRAIFKEPVRDAWLLTALRRCIPYHRSDVSPFERPLTMLELHRFSARFKIKTVRAFSLPFVNVTQALPPLRRYIDIAYRLDGAILNNHRLKAMDSGSTEVD